MRVTAFSQVFLGLQDRARKRLVVVVGNRRSSWVCQIYFEKLNRHRKMSFSRKWLLAGQLTRIISKTSLSSRSEKIYTIESWLTFCRIKNLEITLCSAWCAFPLLQGLFIFLIHVLRNNDVRAAYLRKRQKWKDLRSISTSRVSSKGVDVSSNTLANEDIQELTSKRTVRPWSSGTAYTNTSFVEQDRGLTPVQM